MAKVFLDEKYLLQLPETLSVGSITLWFRYDYSLTQAAQVFHIRVLY
jgi:hypothetical protein